jgi:general secretion pathway protein G
MSEGTGKHCAQCGALLLAGRRYCLACQALVPGASHLPEGQLAELARAIPSTHRPDKTLVFVPEHRETRLKRERRNRRALVATLLGCLLLTVVASVVWRANQRKQVQAQLQRREVLARRELDLYAKALESFSADAGRYPSKQEGLAALLKRPPTLAIWRGPYIEGDYSVDPWGNEYVYRVYDDGAGFELFTYGPEGEAAGRAFLRVSAGTGVPVETPKP